MKKRHRKTSQQAQTKWEARDNIIRFGKRLNYPVEAFLINDFAERHPNLKL